MRHVAGLTRAAQARRSRHIHTLRRTDKKRHVLQQQKGTLLVISWMEAEAAVYRHVLVREVVAWYAKDEKRMRDFENLDLVKIVPTLPAGCRESRWR